MTSHLYNRNQHLVSRCGRARSATTIASSRSDRPYRFTRIALPAHVERRTKVRREWIDSMPHMDYQHHMHFAVTAEPGDATLVHIRGDLRILNAQPR